jgi:hypothetical protein
MSYSQEVLEKAREICGDPFNGTVSGWELADELPHIPPPTVFALVGHLATAGKLEADYVKEPRGADGRRVTVYRIPTNRVPTIAERLTAEARELRAAASRLDGLSAMLERTARSGGEPSSR